MAWIKVARQDQLSESSTDGPEKTATLVYIAISDRPTTPVAAETARQATRTGSSVSAARRIPLRGSEHPDDPSRKATKIDAKPDPDSPRTVFTVTIEYSSNVFEEQEEEPDPLARPDTVNLECSSEKETYFMDEGEEPIPIVTSAGEPFETLQERDTGKFKLVIEGNRATVDPLLIAAYLKPNAVCSAPFTVRGFAVGAGEGKMTIITATPQVENGVTYQRVRWEVELAESWDLSIEDRGLCEADPANPGKLRPIMKGTPPVPVDKAWPLDGNGAALPNATDAPAILTFYSYPWKPFNVWGWTP